VTIAQMRFWKMSGAGNDFIVVPCAVEALGEDPAGFVRRVCRRGLSVGADGVLFVTPFAAGSVAPVPGTSSSLADHASSVSSSTPPATAGRRSADAVLVHYNADGGRSDFCGNGTRCAARFAVMMGYAAWPLALLTDCGVLRAGMTDGRVRIEVPTPTAPVSRTLDVGGAAHMGSFLTAGVPHFVVHVDDPRDVDVRVLGAALRSHPGLGAAGANVDFVGRPVDDQGLSGRSGRTADPVADGAQIAAPASDAPWLVRTFERGVEAETLACGSGAIAVAAVLSREGVRSPIALRPASGLDLHVDFESGPDGPRAFHLAGEARVVYEGVLATEVGAP